jgi:anti-sigma regulatory factor (Ser/Thr protein kinase)
MSRQLRMRETEQRELGRAAPSSARWPLRSRLELGAFSSAVPCARLHSRQIVWEWGLGGIAETVELVVSELITNAVKASPVTGNGRPGHGTDWLAPRWVALLLVSDRHQILVQIWDGDPAPPQPADVDENAESGRGLLLVEALSEDWDWYCPAGSSQGKWVWAAVGK